MSQVVTISSSEWQDLAAAIDMATLTGLDNTIGCPDCGDRGGEWIEVRSGTQTKRIVFDLGMSIPEIDALIGKIRTIHARAKF